MALLLSLALLLLAPAVAGAATATLETHRETGLPHNPAYTAATITIAAAPGEANRLTIASVTGGVEARDESVPLHPGPGCAAIDAHAVRCQHPDVSRQTLHVTAGDGEDTVAVSTLRGHELSAELEGGDGSDRLDLSATEATGFANQLDGGAGDDRLVGSPGRDALVLGEGRDQLDGGPGTEDWLENADLSAIVADLGAGTASRAGGTATLTGIESVSGTPAADRLTGGPGPDRLDGGGGDDLLDGGGGDDRLNGDDPLPEPFSLGRDVLLGGDGDDRLEARGGGDRLDGGPGDDNVDPGFTGFENVRDRADCGAGRDRVGLTGPAAILRGCERLQLNTGGTLQELDLRPASAGAAWSVGMTLECEYGRCPAIVTLREAAPPGRRPGALIARRRVVVPDGGRRRARVRLGRRGAALLRRRGGRLAVLIRLRMPFDFDGWEDAYATVAVGR